MFFSVVVWLWQPSVCWPITDFAPHWNDQMCDRLILRLTVKWHYPVDFFFFFHQKSRLFQLIYRDIKWHHISYFTELLEHNKSWKKGYRCVTHSHFFQSTLSGDMVFTPAWYSQKSDHNKDTCAHSILRDSLRGRVLWFERNAWSLKDYLALCNPISLKYMQRLQHLSHCGL